MNREERTFALTISGVHGVDHLLKRLFPPLVPVWALAFGFPLWKLGVVIGALTFGAGIGQAPIGHLSDRYDRRYLLPTGVGLIGFGIVVVGLVPFVVGDAVTLSVAGYAVGSQFVGMVLAMFVAGVGSASVHPTGYPLITENVSAGRKGKVLGMWGSASKFGDGLAPAFVGVLLLVTGWAEILLLFGSLALGYAVVLFVLLGSFETLPAARRTDATAQSRSQGSVWDLDSRVYLYPIVVVFVYFVVQLMAANAVTVFLPQFITSVYGYTATVGGVTLGPESTASFYYSGLLLVAGVVQLGTGELTDRFDTRYLLLGYLVVASAVLALFALVTVSPLGLAVVLALLGASLWGMNPARDALVGDITPDELEGRTFGYIWTGTLVASAISPVFVGYIGDVAGLELAFGVLAGVILLSALPVVLLLSPRVYVRGDESPVGSSGD